MHRDKRPATMRGSCALAIRLVPLAILLLPHLGLRQGHKVDQARHCDENADTPTPVVLMQWVILACMRSRVSSIAGQTTT